MAYLAQERPKRIIVLPQVWQVKKFEVVCIKVRRFASASRALLSVRRLVFLSIYLWDFDMCLVYQEIGPLLTCWVFSIVAVAVTNETQFLII